MESNSITKVALPLIAVALVLFLFLALGLLVGRGKNAAPPTPSEPLAQEITAPTSAPSAAPGDLVEIPTGPGSQIPEQLAAVKRAYDKARASLNRATLPNHGGFVEKARHDEDDFSAHLQEAITFAKSHPEIAAQPGAATPEILATAARIKAMEFPTPNTQGRMTDALQNLQATLDALQQVRGGDLGTYRTQLITDLDHAASNISAGFFYLHNGPGSTQPASLP